MIWWTERADSAVATSLRTNAVATLASMPLLVVHFGQINPVGFFANLLIAFPASAAVVSGLLAFAVQALTGSMFASPIVWITNGLLLLCEILIEKFALTPLSVVEVPPIWPDLLAVGGLIALLLRPVRRREA
jgi:predicted membrane metal-binding protein